MSAKLITDTFKQVKNASSDRHTNLKDKEIYTTGEKAKESNDGQTVHKGKSVDENLSILHNFDMELEYGPCIGMTRLERWERAKRFGLNPPEEVKLIVEENIQDQRFIEWFVCELPYQPSESCVDSKQMNEGIDDMTCGISSIEIKAEINAQHMA